MRSMTDCRHLRRLAKLFPSLSSLSKLRTYHLHQRTERSGDEPQTFVTFRFDYLE